MTKELHYFNINGLAEPIRYILHYTKQKFEDVRYDTTAWPIPEVKNALPYGQLPLYKEGGRSLTQSLAITKYVAKDTDLVPKDPWKQAVLDSIVYTLYDFWSSVGAFVKEDDIEMKYQLKKKILEETIDFYFSKFEKHLKENGGYFTGKLSWAEFVLLGIVEASDWFLGIDLAKDYPTVKATLDKIRNSPGVKEYIASRGPYKTPYKTTQYKGLSIFHYMNKGLPK